MQNNTPLTVSEINGLIKTIADTYINTKIYVKGEISNYKKSGGNIFFALKDGISSISVVLWRNDGNYVDGESVTACGKITFWSKNGTYNLTATSIEKAGGNNINAIYQNLKDDFEKKQYFTKKRQFPTKIQNIGIITALEGAVIKDIMYVLENNKFCGTVYIKGCFAQGNSCPKSVREGIEYFNKHYKNLDVLIIARGGGSENDLFGYSSEEVVRAIYESNIFTISAIGHETDTMLSDYAADHRAPTPSIAAETIIKYQRLEQDVLSKSMAKIKDLEYSIMSKISFYELKLNKCSSALVTKNPTNFINGEINKLDQYKKQMKEKINHNIYVYCHDLEKLKFKNEQHNTSKNIKSGYSIIVDGNDNLIENSIEFKNKFDNKETIKIVFSDKNFIINMC